MIVLTGFMVPLQHGAFERVVGPGCRQGYGGDARR